ncbi:MAG: hypothetical protein HC923_01095 [Myxococcales bacterium]|nr:hypothetical protein [Myxococcales bacterium]
MGGITRFVHVDRDNAGRAYQFSRATAEALAHLLCKFTGVKTTRKTMKDVVYGLQSYCQGWMSRAEGAIGLTDDPLFRDPEARARFWDMYWRLYLHWPEAPGCVVEQVRDLYRKDGKEEKLYHPMWRMEHRIVPWRENYGDHEYPLSEPQAGDLGTRGVIRTDLPVSPELKALLDAARGHVMTPAERREQAISFAYGNLALHDPSVKREDIERAYNELYGEK